MPHVLEPAPSARAKCRGCGERIAAAELRFGERLPNPFAEGEGGEMTHWFHLKCAAFRRPEAVIETLEGATIVVDGKEDLLREATLGVTYRRLPRVNVAARATTGRAACRQCREPIVKDAWRVSLVYYEDGRFLPSGFVHLPCVAAYFETTEIMSRVKHFSRDLTDADLEEISSQVQAS